mgnify:FL=1
MIISRIINDIISSSWQDCIEAAYRDPQLSNRVLGIMRSEKFIPDQSQAYTVMNMQPSIGAGGSPMFETVSTVSDCAINSRVRVFILFQFRIHVHCGHVQEFTEFCDLLLLGLELLACSTRFSEPHTEKSQTRLESF